jgi:hypothetical protein
MKALPGLCLLAVALALCNPCVCAEKTELSEQKKSGLAKIRADIEETRKFRFPRK